MSSVFEFVFQNREDNSMDMNDDLNGGWNFFWAILKVICLPTAKLLGKRFRALVLWLLRRWRK